MDWLNNDLAYIIAAELDPDNIDAYMDLIYQEAFDALAHDDDRNDCLF